ncbi:MAG: metal-dependent transcriptional regulator [Enterococcus faecalis]
MTPTQKKYLLVIDKFSMGENFVKNREIANFLGVKASSVTEILERLSSQNMVQRVPYKGVHLTSTGIQQVLLMQERQRILFIFLRYYLECPASIIPIISDEFIGINSPTFFEKLTLYIE